jgi:hypothetical protein
MLTLEVLKIKREQKSVRSLLKLETMEDKISDVYSRYQKAYPEIYPYVVKRIEFFLTVELMVRDDSE